MVTRKTALITYKLLFGLLGLTAIVTEVATIVERGNFNFINLLSYFTVETNMLVAVVLLVSAIATAMNKNGKLGALRSAATVYILIVGLGFVSLLSSLEGIVFTAVPWDNIVLHYIMPAAVLLDLLIDRPPHKTPFRRSLPWLLFPVAYASYALTRGAMTGWYPYPFLDPKTNGYGSVALTVTGMCVLALALTWIISMVAGKKRVLKRSA